MIQLEFEADLTERNTFGIKAKAAALATFEDVVDVADILSDNTLPRPVKVIGEGSNLLFCCDYPGTILLAEGHKIHYTDTDGDATIVTASAGLPMDELCRKTAEKGLWGLENLSGIPGTVGASAVQNVGAYGTEAGTKIVKVSGYDTVESTPFTLEASQLNYSYRHSLFKEEKALDRYIITEVTYRLNNKPAPNIGYNGLQSLASLGDKLTPMHVRERVIAVRNTKLPKVKSHGSAGSYFKNPIVTADVADRIAAIRTENKCPAFPQPDGTVKLSAAWLMDHSGCKELYSGGATVWPRQPLVIVNTGGTATAHDIVKLERAIIKRVHDCYGISLTPEVEKVGIL